MGNIFAGFGMLQDGPSNKLSASPEPRYFDRPVSFYETPFLKAKPTSDFIYDYQGERGGRLTDSNQILGMLKEGKIQTSASKFMDYVQEVSGGHDYVGKWKMDTYRAATMFQAVGGASKKGQWGPLRWGGWEKPASSETAQLGAGYSFDEGTAPGGGGPANVQMDNSKKREERMKSFADYIAATNQELNMKDDEEDLEKLNQEMAALKVSGNRKKDFDDLHGRYGFVRYKRAIAGADVTNINQGMNSYLGLDTRGYPNATPGNLNHYAPDWNANN